MQIPILNGIYTDGVADFRVSYPVNLVPVPKEHGISKGYLRPAEGAVANGTGPGISRGGINWNGTCYRVMGTKLVRVADDGAVTTLGDVGGSGQVTLDYSFDRLAIVSSGNLFYWDRVTLTRVTDADLGNVVDVCWIGGYFMTTDGTSLVVTELNDPLSVNPLKYGSSEADPDPINAVMRLRNEVYVVNRYTIEVFSNVGGEFFPFQRIDGAQINRGAIGTHASCVFLEAIAFLGSGKKETPGVYLGINAVSTKISTQEIDTLLQAYTEGQLSEVILEDRSNKSHQHLWVRLLDRTLVYDAAASQVLEEPVWFTLTSAVEGFAAYRAKDLVWCYNKWLVGDSESESVGYLDNSTSHHFGDVVRWEFGTLIVYNVGLGAIVHDLELVCLPGRVTFGVDPRISTSYSNDGETWSQDKFIRSGKQGERNKRLLWVRQGAMRNWRIQRFNGDSNAFLSIARLEARMEGLNV